LCRITTLTFRNFLQTYSPVGLASSQTRPTSRRQKDRGRYLKSTSPRRTRRPNPRPQNSVEADFAVELGADDEVLDLPWASADSAVRYYDLKRKPDLLLHIEEAQRVPALGEFLAAINSRASILETAKCDIWQTTEMKPE